MQFGFWNCSSFTKQYEREDYKHLPRFKTFRSFHFFRCRNLFILQHSTIDSNIYRAYPSILFAQMKLFMNVKSHIAVIYSSLWYYCSAIENNLPTSSHLHLKFDNKTFRHQHCSTKIRRRNHIDYVVRY